MTKKLHIWTLEDGEPTEETKTKGKATGKENKIILRPDVPDWNKAPEAFSEYLKKKHEALNGR